MNKNVLIGIVAAAVIILLVAAAFAMNQPASNNTSIDSTVEQSDSTTPDAASEASETTEMTVASINYTDAGFSPATTTIQKGTVLTIKNESTMDLMFSSADHPTHEDNAELNMDTIKPGASGTITLTKTGTWGYHNHDKADHMGQIIVTE